MQVVWCLIAAGLISAEPVEIIAGIGPTGPIEKYRTGFFFTEGPAWDGNNALYFSDIMQNKVFHAEPDGKVKTIVEKSSLVNGLAVDAAGRLFACQGRSGRIIAIESETGNVQVIADRFEDKPFNQPNDLVLDHAGGLYFTDPEFLTKQLPQGTMGVYYVAQGGNVRRVAKDIDLPNGIALTPDGKTLYVVSMGAKTVLAFPVQAPGEVGPPRVFCQLGLGRGMTIDSKKSLCHQPDLSGIIRDPTHGRTGRLLPFPEKPANYALRRSGPQNPLRDNAPSRSYAAPMRSPGLPLHNQFENRQSNPISSTIECTSRRVL
ncbi:MAG: SMP-30/gluconolactonase/LRE family protein [Planctomycetota bacterium]